MSVPDAPPPSSPRDDVASLGRTALRGARWVTLGRVSTEVLGFASSVALGRLIAPAEFGHAVLALFVGALALAVSQQNVGAALVQMSNMKTRHVEAAMALSLMLGLAAAAVTLGFCAATSSVIDRRTLELIAWMAPAFLLAAPAGVSLALLQRELDFRRQSIVDIASMAANAAVAVTLAAAGFEGEAIVFGVLAQMATQALGLAVYKRPPLPRLHRDELRELRRFGMPAATASLATVATRNVDYVILGARLSARGVGLYWRAFQLGVEYQGKVSGVLLKVAFPIFSRATDRDAIRELRRRIVRLHAVLLFPLLGLLVVIAPTMVPFVYGPDWKGAAELTQWLALAGAAQVVGTGTGPLMLATGHPKALRDWNVLTLVALAAVVLAASGGGVLTAAIAVAIFRCVWFVLGQWFLVQRLLDIRVVDTLRDDVLPAGLATAAAMAAGELALRGLRGVGAGDLLLMAGVAVVLLPVYALVLRLAFRDAAADVARLAARFVPQRMLKRAAPVG